MHIFNEKQPNYVNADILDVVRKTSFGLWSHIEEIDIEIQESFARIFTGIQFSFFNRIAITKKNKENKDLVTKTIQKFQCKNVPFSIMCLKEAETKEIKAQLKNTGLNFVTTYFGMSLQKELLHIPKVQPNITLCVVKEKNDFDAWQFLLHKAAGMPKKASSYLVNLHKKMQLNPRCPFVHLIAYSDAEPLACLTLDIQDGIVSIYNVATLPSARGQGIGSWFLYQTLKHVFDQGVTLAALLSTPMGQYMYEKLGFTTHMGFHLYTTQKILNKNAFGILSNAKIESKKT